MSVIELAAPLFLVVASCASGALLLRAAVAHVNRLLKPQPLLVETSFVFNFLMLLLSSIAAGALCYYLPATMSIIAKVVIATVAQWIYVCFELKDRLKTSLRIAAYVVVLQYIYAFAISLIFLIPYAIWWYPW